jgi:hypothetical protein
MMMVMGKRRQEPRGEPSKEKYEDMGKSRTPEKSQKNSFWVLFLLGFFGPKSPKVANWTHST